MNILVVEDDASARNIVSTLLTRCGHEVVAAENVQDATMLLSNIRFDALVSDIGLPDGNGFELVAEAKRKQQPLTAVAITAWTADEDREKGREAGFDHYLTKPLQFRELRCALAEGLRSLALRP